MTRASTHTYRLRVAYWVYILASRDNGTFYVGMTNDLVRRVAEHRAGLAEGFTKRYDLKRLVYFEPFDDPLSAIRREKNLEALAARVEGVIDR